MYPMQVGTVLEPPRGSFVPSRFAWICISYIVGTGPSLMAKLHCPPWAGTPPSPPTSTQKQPPFCPPPRKCPCANQTWLAQEQQTSNIALAALARTLLYGTHRPKAQHPWIVALGEITLAGNSIPVYSEVNPIN